MKNSRFVLGCGSLALVFFWILTPFVGWTVAYAIVFACGSLRGTLPDDAPLPCGTDTVAIAGQLGDVFGSVNALFSGLALVGLAYGFYLQVQHNRRAKQPEVFARLGSQAKDTMVSLAQKSGTAGGKVWLKLVVPAYVDAGDGPSAYNLVVTAAWHGLEKSDRLPMPLSGSGAREEPYTIHLDFEATVLATFVDGRTLDGKGEPLPFGSLVLSIAFENQAKAKWIVRADYGLSLLAPDGKTLSEWIERADDVASGSRPIRVVHELKHWSIDEAG